MVGLTSVDQRGCDGGADADYGHHAAVCQSRGQQSVDVLSVHRLADQRGPSSTDSSGEKTV